MSAVRGRRVPDGEFLEWQADGRTRRGDYGLARMPGAKRDSWFFVTPNSLLLESHRYDGGVTVWQDGTVTLPKVRVEYPFPYEGSLRHGSWYES